MPTGTIIWTAPEINEQTTPIIPGANYRPEFSKDECDALRTGRCPLESGSIDTDTLCGRMCRDLISGTTPDSPVNILYDKTKDQAIFETGRHITCIYAHIAADYPDLVIPTVVRNCRIYSDRPKDIILITKGLFFDYEGPIADLLMMNTWLDIKLKINSRKTRFTFPPSLSERTIEFAHGKVAVLYDTKWTIINPEDAYDSKYAYVSYMYQYTENWPVDTKERPSIYFTNTADLENAYEEIKALDTAWVPGTTDRIVKSEKPMGEPRIVQFAGGSWE